MEFRTVDIVRAEQFWSALRSSPRGRISFTIEPRDLYDIHGGNSRLGCSESAPVIREMALYASTPSVVGTWADADSRLPMEIGSELSFPTSAGTLEYTKTDTDWLFARVPVIGGDPGIMFQTLRQYFPDNNTAVGLSPFGTFSIDLTRFPTATETVDDVRVLFSLESRPSATTLPLPACVQGQ